MLALNGTIVSAQSSVRSTVLFDDDWRFHRGGALGAEQISFNDSTWRRVDLPHDWSIENLPGKTTPFDPDAISQVNGGFTTGGTGWYRKAFTVPASAANKRLQIQFDGVHSHAEVWVNGQSLGRHPYGYTSFWYDITDKVKAGQPAVVAVQVQNEGVNSRWYTGSGIYRHVWLRTLEPVHVAPWSTAVTTPVVSASAATVRVQATVVNEGGQSAGAVTLALTIQDATGAVVSTRTQALSVGVGGSVPVDQTLPVKTPGLWSVDTPTLYTLTTEIRQNQRVIDRTATPFGIRSISFDVATGFRLNDKPLKLKGGCFHHDHGPLGAKAYDRAEERRVELLKASGYNAVRCSHAPPAPAFLDACDRLGMLVIDEAFDMWAGAKNPHDYHVDFAAWWRRDIESMVSRDRNHPSIIMWSIGNEIPGMTSPAVVAVAKSLSDYVRQLDASRPVTAAVNGLSSDKDPFFATFDIAGYNYAVGGDHNQKSIYRQDHARLPNRVIYGTESYPLDAFGSWMAVLDDPYVIGDFVWTAVDYIGEASIGWRGYVQNQDFYPWNLAYCGDIDVCGWKRPQSHYRDALWKTNQLAVFVGPPRPTFTPNPARMDWSRWHWHDVVADWTWPASTGKPMAVTIYSSCEEVELTLNGQSLGRKPTNRSTRYEATWEVAYQPGVLKAVGYSEKKLVSEAELRSADAPRTIRLTADRPALKADGQDLSYITVTLMDQAGNRNPKAENLVNFEIDGPGTIVGVGNANPVSIESCQDAHRNAWQGRCLVIVKSGKQAGTVRLRATSAGLTPAQVVLTTKAVN